MKWKDSYFFLLLLFKRSSFGFFHSVKGPTWGPHRPKASMDCTYCNWEFDVSCAAGHSENYHLSGNFYRDPYMKVYPSLRGAKILQKGPHSSLILYCCPETRFLMITITSCVGFFYKMKTLCPPKWV